MMSEINPYSIDVEVSSTYVKDQSEPEAEKFVFAYTIKIINTGQFTATLINRHWVITDGNEHKQEVRGKGVIGEQPKLKPGESFEYSSGAMIKTPVGTMHGSYEMHAEDGCIFDASIPAFLLSIPNYIH